MCHHGRVPGCSSCPCSVPPVSAKGAKVSADTVGSICVLPLVLPHGVCAPLLCSRNADPHTDKNCCVSFLLYSLSPAFGAPPLLPRCCFVASFH